MVAWESTNGLRKGSLSKIPSQAITNGHPTSNGKSAPTPATEFKFNNWVTSLANRLAEKIHGQPEQIAALIITLITRRFPALFIGHSGSGKTFGVEETAKLALDNPLVQFKKVNCGINTTKSQLFGYFDPKTGKYVEGVFNEETVIYLFDEFPRLPEEAQGLALEVFEHRKVRLDSVPGGKEQEDMQRDEVVKLHPNAVFFLTGNTDEDSGSFSVIQPVMERMGVVFRCNHASEDAYVSVANDNPLDEPGLQPSPGNRGGVRRLASAQEHLRQLVADKSFPTSIANQIGMMVFETQKGGRWDNETVSSPRTVKAATAAAYAYMEMNSIEFGNSYEDFEARSEMIAKILRLIQFEKLRPHRDVDVDDTDKDNSKKGLFKQHLLHGASRYRKRFEAY